MISRIVCTLLLIGFCAAFSAMLFPPGDVPRQFVVVGLWFFRASVQPQFGCADITGETDA